MPNTNEKTLTAVGLLPDNPTLEDVEIALEEMRERAMIAKAKRKLAVEARKAVKLESMQDIEGKYRGDMPRLLIEHLRGGKSFQTFAALAGTSVMTIYRWMDKYPQFKQAKGIGEALQMDTWEDLLISVANGSKKGDFKAISFALKNYFPDEYADRKEIEQVATQIIIDTGVHMKADKSVELRSANVDTATYQPAAISLSMEKAISAEPVAQKEKTRAPKNRGKVSAESRNDLEDLI
jgi:hypothetical protein